MIVNASCSSTISMSCGSVWDILYASLAASRVAFKPTSPLDSTWDRLAPIVFCPIPLIQIGISVNSFAFIFEAKSRADEPVHTKEQSSFFRGSEIILEFITSSTVTGSLNKAIGFLDEFLRFLTDTKAICSSVVPKFLMWERANNDAQWTGRLNEPLVKSHSSFLAESLVIHSAPITSTQSCSPDAISQKAEIIADVPELQRLSIRQQFFGFNPNISEMMLEVY